jgi:hypothetical protein
MLVTCEAERKERVTKKTHPRSTGNLAHAWNGLGVCLSAG